MTLQLDLMFEKTTKPGHQLFFTKVSGCPRMPENVKRLQNHQYKTLHEFFFGSRISLPSPTTHIPLLGINTIDTHLMFDYGLYLQLGYHFCYFI